MIAVSDATATKVCVRCGREKPRVDFHRRTKAYDGLNAACKECICQERRLYTAANPDRLRAARKRYDADPEKHARKLERTREWRQANPDKVVAYRDQHYVENRDRYRAWSQAWYQANRDWVLAWPQRNPEKSRERFQRYREAHREVVAERQRRRRVDKLGLKVEDVDLDALWTGACALCVRPLDRSIQWPHPLSKSIDHIVPLARGGTHEPTNLQWTHLRCNVSKGARLD